MTTYEISNKASGHVLGEYQGVTERDALDALARDAGYDNYDDAYRQGLMDENDLTLSPVPPVTSSPARYGRG
mgnify:FL=1